VIAEYVLRCDLHRRILRTCGADDHGLLRVLLRPVGDRDGLVARQRPEHDFPAELNHEATRLLERQSRRLVTAADPDDLEILTTGLAAGHPRGRFLLVLRLRARVLRERRNGARSVHLEPERERALTVGHDRNLHVAALRRCSQSAGGCDYAACDEQRQRKQELPLTYLHIFPPSRACTSNLPFIPEVSLRESRVRFQPPFTTSLPPPRPHGFPRRSGEGSHAGGRHPRSAPRVPSDRRAR
jgi:hypothetical protein